MKLKELYNHIVRLEHKIHFEYDNKQAYLIMDLANSIVDYYDKKGKKDLSKYENFLFSLIGVTFQYQNHLYNYCTENNPELIIKQDIEYYLKFKADNIIIKEIRGVKVYE